MAYTKTYTFKYTSSANIRYILEFHDQGSNAGTWEDEKGVLGKNNCQIDWGSENAKMFSPLKPSTLTIDFMVTDQKAALYIKNLKSDRQERDVYVYLYNTGTTGVKKAGDSPVFAGYLLMDLSDDPDIAMPYPIKLRAIDGLASLKYYDFIPHSQAQRPDHLYSYGETWKPGGANYSFNTFYPFRQWISRILQYTGYATTDKGCGTNAEFQTSVNWFNSNMPNLTGDPLNWTRALADQFYTAEGDTGNIKYRPLNCYDALQFICKTWGMRCFAYRNTFYFIGINTYTANNSGTLASPENINFHRYSITGTPATPSSGDALDLDWGRYHIPVHLTTNNKKIAGSQYGILPAFKRVSVDFLNISNINYFQGFPKIPQPYPISTGSGVMYNEEIIGNFDFDGTTQRNFFQQIYLDFQNNSGGDVRYEFRWHIQAKKVGTNTWYQYGYNNWSSSNLMPNWFSMAGIPQSTSVFARGHLIVPPGASSYNIVTDVLNAPWFGTSINSYVECPSTVFSAGDWEFKYVTVTAWYSGSQNIAFGHGRCDPIPNPGTSYLKDPDSNFITYTDSTILQGAGASMFSPISNGVIGTEETATQIVQSGSDTEFEEVTDVLWGDLPGAGAGRIQVFDGTNWVPSGFLGTWGIDTLSGGNSLSETLCEEIFKRQAKNVRKFSTKINLDAENIYQIDSSGSRAMYGTPFTKWFTPSHFSSATFPASWIMHTGTYDTGADTWALTLYEFETFNVGTTTTTTGTNGSNSGGTGTNSSSSSLPNSSGGVGKTLSNPTRNNSRAIAQLRQNAIRPLTVITASQGLTSEGTLTVTSLTVQAIPNAILKAGDIILLMCAYQPEATQSLDETNTIEYGNVEFEVASDQSAGDTTISVTSKTIYQIISTGDVVTISQPDLMAQYQNKTRGSIASLPVTATTIGSATDAIYIQNGSSELLVNGDFDTDSNWTKNAGWTISGGKANRDGTGISNSDIVQSIPVVNGKTYTFSYTRTYISGGGTTNIYVQTNGVNYVTLGNYTSTIQESHTVTGTFTALFTGNMNWKIYGIGTFTGSIDDASVTVSLKGIGVGNNNPTTALDVTGTVNATTFTGDLNGTINTATTAVTQSANNNSTKVATTAYVDSATASVPKGLQYQGTWNAATNTPTIVSGTGVVGYYYIVATAGTTTIDGISDWAVGDWIIFTDHTTDHWQKIDQSESDTLQTVTTRGATTTDSITVGGLTTGSSIIGPSLFEIISQYSNRGRITLSSTTSNDASIQIGLLTNGNQRLTITKGGTVNIVNDLTIGGTVDGRDVAADGTQLDTNTSSISTNTSNISTNTSNISTNASAIATKASASDVSTNTSNISTNTTNIATNETDIATNTTAIGTKASSASVATNTSAIATNSSNVAANTTDIATNTSAIATKASASSVSTNTTNIATNTSNISTNASDISTNATAIATKASASSVTTNTTNIATNTSNISTNTTAIAGKANLSGAIFTGNVTVGSNNLTAAQIYVQGTYPRIYLSDTDSDDDYSIINNNGTFIIYNDTDSNIPFAIAGNGQATFTGNIVGTTANFTTSSGDNLIVIQTDDQGVTTDAGIHFRHQRSTAGSYSNCKIYMEQFQFYIEGDEDIIFRTNGVQRAKILAGGGLYVNNNITLGGTVDGRDVAADGTQLDTNTSAISTNTSNISTNTSNISTNTSAIATKASASSVSTNTANIATNTSNISSNDTDIATNVTNIASNTSSIQTNASNISSNSTDISTNSSSISTNTSNISTNTSNISTNTSAIATKASATSVATNTSNISSNTTAIATKASLSGDTFTGLVSGITPTANANFTTKAYTDTLVGGGITGKTTIRSITYNGLPSGAATEDWFELFTITDTMGPVNCKIFTYAHDAVEFSVAEGYGPSNAGTISIINSVHTSNSGFATVSAIRILQNGNVEMKLVFASNPTVNIGINITGFNVPTLNSSLTVATSTSTQVDIVYVNVNGLLRSKSRIEIGDATAGSTNSIRFRNDGNSWISNYNLSLGTTSASERLTISGNIAVTGTVDGVDIAARDAVLTSTTSTANTNTSNITTNATAITGKVSKSGDTITGNIAMSNNDITGVGNLSINAGSLSITADGSNAVTFTESSAGILTIATPDDFIVDAGGDINLDAGGNDIRLKAAGTTFGKFTSSSNHFLISAPVANNDIILQANGTGDIRFKADDGAGTATAYFRLDGSDVMMKAHKNIRYLTNVKATFGNSDELQIYHDGSNSYISDTGTGNLSVTTNSFRLLNAAANENLIQATENGSVILYHNNIAKLETTSTGIDVTGEVQGDSLDIDGNADISGTLNVSDPVTITGPAAASTNGILNIEDDSGNTSLRFGGNSTYSWIQSHNSKPLKINELGNNVTFGSGTATFGGTITSNGITSTDNININRGTDGSLVFQSSNASKFLIGYDSSPEGFRIYNYITAETALNINGSDSLATFAGNVDINGNTLTIGSASHNFSYISATTSLRSSGNLEATGTFRTYSNLTVDGTTTFGDSVHLDNDSAQLQLGDDNDMQIYHNGANGVIDNNTGDLIIKSDSDDIKILAEDDVVIRDNDDSTEMAKFINGGSVELYYNGSKKLETKSDGVTVTGEFEANNLDIDSGTWPPNKEIVRFYNGFYDYRIGYHSRQSVGHSFQIYANSTVANINWNSGILKIGTETSNNLEFYTGDTTAFTLDSSQNATFLGDARLPASGKLYLWTGHDSNYLKYDLWTASASVGMTIENTSAAGEIYLKSGNALTLTLDDSQNATFAGNITTNNSSKIENGRISMEADGTLDWGAAKDYGTLTWDTGKAIVRGQTGNALEFQTDGSGAALSLATNKNATFYGTIYLNLSATSQRAITSTGTESIQFGDAGVQMLRFKNAAGIPLDIAANGNASFANNIIQEGASNTITLSGGSSIVGSNHLFLKGAASYVHIRSDNNSIYLDGTNFQFRTNDGTSTYFTLDSTRALFYGEVEASSLDINGNADISGNLTGVDEATFTGQVSINRSGNANDTTLVMQDNARMIKIGRDAFNVYGLDGSTAQQMYIQGNGGNTTFGGNIVVTGTVDGVDIATRDAVITTNTNNISTNATQIQANATAIATKAPIASPTFTGSPAAPTAPAGTNNTKIATTAFVTAAVAAGGGTVNRGSFTPSTVQSIGSGGVTGTKSTLTFDTSKITAVGMSIAATGVVNIDDSGDYMINLNFGTESYLTQNRILGAAQIQYSSDGEEWFDIDGSKIYTYNRGVASGSGASTWGTIYEGSGHSAVIKTVADDSYIRVQFWVDGRSSSSTGMRTVLDSCRLSLHKIA